MLSTADGAAHRSPSYFEPRPEHRQPHSGRPCSSSYERRAEYDVFPVGAVCEGGTYVSPDEGPGANSSHGALHGFDVSPHIDGVVLAPGKVAPSTEFGPLSGHHIRCRPPMPLQRWGGDSNNAARKEMTGAHSAGDIVACASAALDAGCDVVLVCNDFGAMDDLLARWTPPLQDQLQRRWRAIAPDSR